MTRSQLKQLTVLNAVTASGAGIARDVRNYQSVCFQIATANSANCTIKFAISLSDNVPNFGNASTATNSWSYVSIRDLANTGSVIAGATGISFSGTDGVYNVIIDTNFVKWVCPIITTYVAGTITIINDSINNNNY